MVAIISKNNKDVISEKEVSDIAINIEEFLNSDENQLFFKDEFCFEATVKLFLLNIFKKMNILPFKQLYIFDSLKMDVVSKNKTKIGALISKQFAFLVSSLDKSLKHTFGKHRVPLGDQVSILEVLKLKRLEKIKQISKKEFPRFKEVLL